MNTHRKITFSDLKLPSVCKPLITDIETPCLCVGSVHCSLQCIYSVCLIESLLCSLRLRRSRSRWLRPSEWPSSSGRLPKKVQSFISLPKTKWKSCITAENHKPQVENNLSLHVLKDLQISLLIRSSRALMLLWLIMAVRTFALLPFLVVEKMDAHTIMFFFFLYLENRSQLMHHLPKNPCTFCTCHTILETFFSKNAKNLEPSAQWKHQEKYFICLNLYELILFVKSVLFMMHCCSAFRERALCEMGFSWRNVQQFTVRGIGQPERRRYWLLKLSLPPFLLFFFLWETIPFTQY